MSDALTQGTDLADRYRLVERMPDGVCGERWRVVDTQGPDARLTWLSPPRSLDGALRAKRLEALGRFGHPHAVPTRDTGMFRDAPFVVSALFEGRSLRAWVDDAQSRRAPLALRDVRTILDQVAQALAAAHRGVDGVAIVHGGALAPSVTVERRGEVQFVCRVDDLGLLALTQATTLVPGARDDGPAVLDDIYSLGTLLAEVLTGTVLAPGGDVDAACDRLAQARPEVHPSLWKVVRACIAPSPGDRPESVARVRELLRQAIWTPREVVRAPEAPPPPPPPPPPPAAPERARIVAVSATPVAAPPPPPPSPAVAISLPVAAPSLPGFGRSSPSSGTSSAGSGTSLPEARGSLPVSAPSLPRPSMALPVAAPALAPPPAPSRSSLPPLPSPELSSARASQPSAAAVPSSGAPAVSHFTEAPKLMQLGVSRLRAAPSVRSLLTDTRGTAVVTVLPDVAPPAQPLDTMATLRPSRSLLVVENTVVSGAPAAAEETKSLDVSALEAPTVTPETAHGIFDTLPTAKLSRPTADAPQAHSALLVTAQAAGAPVAGRMRKATRAVEEHVALDEASEAADDPMMTLRPSRPMTMPPPTRRGTLMPLAGPDARPSPSSSAVFSPSLPPIAPGGDPSIAEAFSEITTEPGVLEARGPGEVSRPSLAAMSPRDVTPPDGAVDDPDAVAERRKLLIGVGVVLLAVLFVLAVAVGSASR